MPHADYIAPFEALTLSDVPRVGGKTASLGELTQLLRGEPVRVPEGFAVTAAAYRDALSEADAWPKLRDLLAFDIEDVAELGRRAAQAREVVYQATGGQALRDQIVAAYRGLQ